MSKYLEELAVAQLREQQARTDVTILAIQCRNEGDTWSDIARALGITKQAANRRFSRYVIDTPRTGHGA